MRVKQLQIFLFMLFNVALLAECHAMPPGCIPLYVSEYSNRNAKINIREPGKYCLMMDLHARFDFADHPAEGRQIYIWSSNVELDLMGHTLGRGRFIIQPGDIGIEIGEDARNIVIKNGHLENFSVGIYRTGYKQNKKEIVIKPTLNDHKYLFSKDHITLENITFKNCKQNILFYDWVDKPTTDMQLQMPAK